MILMTLDAPMFSIHLCIFFSHDIMPLLFMFTNLSHDPLYSRSYLLILHTLVVAFVFALSFPLSHGNLGNPVTPLLL
jgi:hypothetical protein